MNQEIKTYKISLTSGDDIYFNVTLELVDVLDWLTQEKQTTFFETNKKSPTTIFRKHIVKITEVK